jgi:hypothetical protein
LLLNIRHICILTVSDFHGKSISNVTGNIGCTFRGGFWRQAIRIALLCLTTKLLGQTRFFCGHIARRIVQTRPQIQTPEQSSMSKVFVNVGLSLDGYMAPDSIAAPLNA